MSEEAINTQQNNELEGGAYEIIRDRLLKDSNLLVERLQQLNQSRKEVFGSIATELITNERITTENKCIPRDMVAFGDHFIFGYNVHIGLRLKTNLNDVFTVCKYENHEFHLTDLKLINDDKFIVDFENLYQYYRDTVFTKFAEIGPYIYMVFKIGKKEDDIKAFKWRIDGDQLIYVDNQSSHEFVFPRQQEFVWKSATREMYRSGEHPHISIEDLVFVETVGGDLTIKIEDNTDSGKGIYNEPVDYPDQSLEDADTQYAILGNLVLLKILPYREKEYRHFIYNIKMKSAQRIDAIEKSCILLPDDYGVIFPKGIYLQTGEIKLFNLELNDLLFERKIASPNGEDYLYVFYNQSTGTYLMLSYNLIEQTVETPIVCHGFTIFENGEMCYFKTEEEPQSHHAIQVWKTPFLSESFIPEKKTNSFLEKIGNKDVVRAMSECYEISNLIQKEDNYANLYIDIVKNSTDVIDSYYWLDHKESFDLKSPLQGIKSSASSAIDEYEKVVRLKNESKKSLENIEQQYQDVIRNIKRSSYDNIQVFVDQISQIRTLRGQAVSLKDLRYINLVRIDEINSSLEDQNKNLSEKCVKFLLKKEALLPYFNQVKQVEENVKNLKKVIEASQLEERIVQISSELEMLIEVVSNLKIEDATETTRIIDSISDIYSQFNLINSSLKKKKKALKGDEGKAEFNAQIKLVSQGVVNYLDLCDEPKKCEDYLSKLMIQLEELEGKFSDFEEFIETISEKRDEVYNAFEARKIQLIEKRNKRSSALHSSAVRIINGIANRLKGMKSINDINGYMVSDLMVEKVRDIIEDLIELGDTVKADEIQSKIKTTQQDAIRQLKDKTELFDSENTISFGSHKFLVNNQVIDLTIVPRNDEQYFHITGTNFFERISDESFLATRNVWSQSIVSENKSVYRSEYLAWLVFNDILNSNSIHQHEVLLYTDEELNALVYQFMSNRYEEAYAKGVHDADAVKILKELLHMNIHGGVLKYATIERATAIFFWSFSIDEELKKDYTRRIIAAGLILQVFPNDCELDHLKQELSNLIETFAQSENLSINPSSCASYLIEELNEKEQYSISKEAFQLGDKFNHFLKEGNLTNQFKDSIASIDNWFAKYNLTISWVNAFAKNKGLEDLVSFAEEAAIFMLLTGDRIKLSNFSMHNDLTGFVGDHNVISNNNYALNYHEFVRKLLEFSSVTVENFKAFNALKKELITKYKEELRLQEFKPKVMSSFVRNKLINDVYLPLIGDNLAKQIGGAGENKRTDLMGMLLLISPPGYGKTTLMEYIASRLGIVFLKVNGPAIGHDVVSLDPADAPNASAREEIEKLNLGFEMGDNVMIYLDDIQHCNPEFLQKFISLCDGQRKIEGVYKGKSKTYDLRGKKVCVVMAGNPFTESGDKFQIPDMLSNRADIYNLGDIIGDKGDAFKLSYIENSLTSNKVLRNLSGKSQKDLYSLIKMVETGSVEGIDFESNHSQEEVKDYTNILGKMLKVRDIILDINKEYIKSAAMDDQYRIEPSFKLQGSYRNMNRIAEKIITIMNEEELNILIRSYYENESQTLTQSAESNLLKFKEITNWLNPEEEERWTAIKEQFTKSQKLKGFGANQQMGAMLSQIELLNQGITGIHKALSK